jgi:hypothetical protein
MEYTVNKIQDQSFGYNISMEHLGKKINFNVFCANSETEIPELVAHHLAFLEAPVPVYQTEPQVSSLQTLLEQQQALITQLTARITALENA